MPRTRITKKAVDAAKPGEKDYVIWDTDVTGFGLKVTPKGRKVFILYVRYAGRQRRITIGRYGAPWSPDTARDKALNMLARATAGKDPAQEPKEASKITIAKWMDTYFEEGCSGKKASTIAVEKGLAARHIKPLIGNRPILSLTKGDVQAFRADVANGKTAGVFQDAKKRGKAVVKGGKGTANRTLCLLSAAMSHAVETEVLAENPCSRIKPYKMPARQRFLSDQELAELGDAIRAVEAEGANHSAIAALRLLILTGCRKSEILGLRWREVDLQRGLLRLEDSKTGGGDISVGEPVLEILRKLPRKKDSEYVFPAASGDGHYIGLPKVWRTVRKRAKLSDVRMHDLRHSYASFGAGRGVSLLIIGKLLGHKQARTTQIYAHLADNPVKQAAGDISEGIAGILDGKKPATKTAEEDQSTRDTAADSGGTKP